MNHLSKKILFVVSEDWYFFSHRIHLARYAIQCGYEVGLLSNFSTHKNEIENIGVITFDWNLNRSSKNIVKEFKSINRIKDCIKLFKPTLVHSVALKPVLYSSIACSFLSFKNKVFALAGLGYIFTSDRKRMKILRAILKLSFKILLKGNKTTLILQNPEDQNTILKQNIISKNRIRLIRGAGVDISKFYLSPILKGLPLIGLPSRMLWAKGINDFIHCAKEINKHKTQARFVLIGTPDKENPDAVPTEKLKEWQSAGIIEWWGYRSDMVDVYKQSTIICLPTIYGEGLPKTLLEAASCGRPIVTYDVPGCREIVEDGYNGYLLKPRELDKLVTIILNLITNPNLCKVMGINGRKIVEKNFTQEKIAKQTLNVWEKY